MKKQLLAVAVSILVVAGIASATEILQTPAGTPNVGTPKVRPSLTKLLDKRPTLPHKTPVATGGVMTGNNTLPPKSTTGAQTGSGVKAGTGIIQSVIKQNAEEVQAYREENGYITRYLIKQSTADARNNMAADVQKAVKTLLAGQKALTQAYQAAAKTGSLMTKEQWSVQVETLVETYRKALLTYIDSAKMTDFDKFIIGRKNLMKALFDKLEIIRTVKTSK